MTPSLRLPAPAALLLAAALASPASAGDPPPPLDASTRDFDQVHIALRVAPRIAEGVIDGEATLSFTSLADPLRTLRLHCEDTEVLAARDGKGRSLPFRLEGGILSLDLAAPLPRDAAEAVTVSYRSRPRQGVFFHAPTPDAPSTPLSLYSQGEGTDNRRWFPCYDEPDDRLTCEVLATVPTDLRTVSNGLLLGSRPAGEGLREDHWKLEQRVPTYLVSLIVGKYETAAASWEGIPLEYNAPPGRAAEMALGCDGTPAMMAFFSEYTGRRYPYPRYAQTTVWDFVYGGMENASATTMNMRLLHGKEARPNYSGDGLVAHELAHQWFGDLLTCRTWNHLWLNEGFATYFTDLFFEHRDGVGVFSLERREQNRRYMERTPEPAGLGLEPAPRGDVPLELFGGKQYNRGAAILHQLRLELGDGPFRDGIRRYVKENEDRAVVSEDLRRSMEAAAGRDLSWFFGQWVYGAGYPVLEASAEFRDGSLLVTLEQVQKGGGGQPEVFRISLPVAFPADGKLQRHRLDLRARKATFALPAAAAPAFLLAGDG
ncbi:MAG: M1 family metallopeptidase, partial [Planctomycetaceae bacterium]|nr:M1 family metallopeptidase [Planctomycetaceae bacterium]